MSDEPRRDLSRPKGERPVYRYTQEEMQHIKQLIDDRDRRWLRAVWDPVLQDVEGMTLSEATENGFVVDVSSYGIPWDQSVQISKWVGVALPMAWLTYGPSPVEGE